MDFRAYFALVVTPTLLSLQVTSAFGQSSTVAFSLKAGQCAVISDQASKITGVYAQKDVEVTAEHISCILADHRSEKCEWDYHLLSGFERLQSLTPTEGFNFYDGDQTPQIKEDGFFSAGLGVTLRKLTANLVYWNERTSNKCSSLYLYGMNDIYRAASRSYKNSHGARFAYKALANANSKGILNKSDPNQKCSIRYHALKNEKTKYRYIELYVGNQLIGRDDFSAVSYYIGQALINTSPLKFAGFNDYYFDMEIGAAGLILTRQLVDQGICRQLEIIPTGDSEVNF